MAGVEFHRQGHQLENQGKAEAALVASMVHSGDYTVGSIKKSLAHSGIPVRLTD